MGTPQRTIVATLLLAPALWLPGARAYAQGERIASPAAQAGPAVEAANRAFRAAVDSALRTAARAARIELDPADFVAGSDGAVLIANAAVAGADSVSERDLSRGINLLFTYVSSRTVRFPYPPGFYIFRVVRPRGAPSAVAQVVSLDGRVVATLPATISGPFEAAARTKWKVKLTGKFRPPNDWEVDIELEPRESTARNAARMVSIVVPLGGQESEQ